MCQKFEIWACELLRVTEGIVINRPNTIERKLTMIDLQINIDELTEFLDSLHDLALRYTCKDSFDECVNSATKV